MKKLLKEGAPILYRIGTNIKYIADSYKYFKVLQDLNKLLLSQGDSFHSKKIIFNQVRVFATSIIFFESFLAAKLNLMGADAKVLIDDGILKCYDTASCTNAISDHDLKFRGSFAKKFLNNLPLYKPYSNFVTKENLKQTSFVAQEMIDENRYIYLEINLWPFIESSMVRFFKSALGFIKDEPNYGQVLKLCTENAINSCLVASKVDSMLKPDVIVTSHAIYSTWGPFYEYFKRCGKRVITYGFSGFKNNGVIFSQRGLVANRCDDGFFEAYQDKIDLRLANEAVKEFFDKRFKGESADLKVFGNYTENDKFLKELQVRIDKKQVFAIFSNVLWDNSLIGADSIFQSQVEWLLETVTFFSKENDKLLILRAHPAEASFMKPRASVRDILERKLGTAIENIKNIIFISPDTPIRSYSLFPMIKAGIVYNGTIGLEMLYKNIPCIIAGKAPYSNAGFTASFNDKADYFDVFTKVSKIQQYQKKHRELLIKYLFYYFYLNEIPLSFFDENKLRTLRRDVNSSFILKDKNLKHIADTILEQKDFFQSWLFNEK
jgi:hypothetical protein